jgi:hypothetical protein
VLKQNTPEWLAARCPFSASETAAKTGCARYGNVRSEWWWLVEHPGEQKPFSEEGQEHMRRGHLNEQADADMAFELLFPRPEVQALGDTDEETKHYRMKQNAMRTCGIYPHPLRPKMISASPDRILCGHPDRSIVVGLEIKDKAAGLPTRPDVDHLMQNHTQMACLQADYIFIAYGFRRRSVILFLIQNEPKLWQWIEQRFDTFQRCVESKREPSKDLLPQIGSQVYEYWNTGKVPESALRDLGPCARWPGYWPPQPRWMLLGYYLHPGDSPADLESKLQQFSPTGAPASDIVRRALGLLRRPFLSTEVPFHSRLLFGQLRPKSLHLLKPKSPLLAHNTELLCSEEAVLQLIEMYKEVLDCEQDPVTFQVIEYAQLDPKLLGLHARYFAHLKGWDENTENPRLLGTYSMQFTGRVIDGANEERRVFTPLRENPPLYARQLEAWFTQMFPLAQRKLQSTMGSTLVPDGNVATIHMQLVQLMCQLESDDLLYSWWQDVPLEK